MPSYKLSWISNKKLFVIFPFLDSFLDDDFSTCGCNTITANAKARIMVITMKKTLRLQSWPEGLNQMKRIPEKTNVMM